MNLISWVLAIGTKILRMDTTTWLTPQINICISKKKSCMLVILCFNSLIMPHLNYSILAWGTKSNKIELLQKQAIRVLYSKFTIAHTTPLYYKDETTQVIGFIHLQSLELYHKLYRYRLPPYFDNFLPEFGEHHHKLRNDLIWLPVVRCEFGEKKC